jgi:hypothetical protein
MIDNENHAPIDTNPAQVSPVDMLNAYDRFMGGAELNTLDRAIVNRLTKAGSFAAEAFMYGFDADQGAHALTRAFICVLIDPLHPDLDYLRADPASGAQERAKREGRTA